MLVLGSVEMMEKSSGSSRCHGVVPSKLKGEACCETAWQPRGKQSLKPASIMHLGFSNPARRAGPW